MAYSGTRRQARRTLSSWRSSRPLESELPSAGRLVVSDGALQLDVDGSDAALRQRFREGFEDRVERARRFLLQRRIPVLLLDTVRPVAEQVRERLGYAPRTRRALTTVRQSPAATSAC